MGVVSSDALTTRLLIRQLGLVEYVAVWQQMQAFTQQRSADTSDEIWLVQHPPVFTLGRNGKMEHVLAPGDIPVIPIDRGGQVTYHGPGQLVAYMLLDIRRKALGVRELVTAIEKSVIDLLAHYGITAVGDREAPGVYVAGRKIAALGLRISKGCTYHGLSLNVAMDLEPFQRINPCGYAGLQVTQCENLGIESTPVALAQELCEYLAQRLHYSTLIWSKD